MPEQFFIYPAVKPDKPTNVSAVTQRSRVLTVTWDKPVKGAECQLRYHALATVWEDWKVSLSVTLLGFFSLNLKGECSRKQILSSTW